MGAFKDANTRDGVNTYLESIANSLCGAEETAYTGANDRLRHSLERIAGHFEDVGAGVGTPAAKQAASTATTVEGIVTDFNALLTKLKEAGIMASE